MTGDEEIDLVDIAVPEPLGLKRGDRVTMTTDGREYTGIVTSVTNGGSMFDATDFPVPAEWYPAADRLYVECVKTSGMSGLSR